MKEKTLKIIIIITCTLAAFYFGYPVLQHIEEQRNINNERMTTDDAITTTSIMSIQAPFKGFEYSEELGTVLMFVRIGDKNVPIPIKGYKHNKADGPDVSGAMEFVSDTLEFEDLVWVDIEYNKITQVGIVPK